MDKRLIRTSLILGKERLKKMQNSKVTVVGLGAVGSYVVEGLARAGVKHLRLVDFDTVEESNINRQLYALDSTIGLPKAELAKKRVLDINPKIKVEAFEMFADDKTYDKILDNKPNLVIDAIDSLTPKTQLLAKLYEKAIPVISSMGAGLKTDPTKIHIGDLFTTKHCALARFVRKRLRRQGIKHGIPCVYSVEMTNNERLERVDQEEDRGSDENGRKRNVLGSLPTITGMFGLTISHYAIDYLCGGLIEEDKPVINKILGDK